MNVLAVPSDLRHPGTVTTAARVSPVSSLARVSLGPLPARALSLYLVTLIVIGLLSPLAWGLNCAASTSKAPNTTWRNSSNNPEVFDSAEAACRALLYDPWDFDHVGAVESGHATCYVKHKTDPNRPPGDSLGWAVPTFTCEPGYVLQSGSATPLCLPSNACPNGGTYDNTTSYCYNVPDCPAGQTRHTDCSCAAASSCGAGEAMGEGSIWMPSVQWDAGAPCIDGCTVQRTSSGGMVALGVPERVEGIAGLTHTGSWEKSGGLCSAPQGYSLRASLKKDLPPPKPGTTPPVNCVNDATGKSMCISRERPGCGYYNGNKFCADELPNSGECQMLGKSGYLCTGNATPPPPPNPADPPPKKGGDILLPGYQGRWPGDGKTTWPGDDKNHWPGDGNGGWPGDSKNNWPGDRDEDGDGKGPGDGPGPGGDQTGSFGDYPGGDNGSGKPDGKGPGGDCTGTNCLDTSGLAKETTLSGILGSLNTIKDGLGGQLTGNGFTGTPGPKRDNLDINSEIETKKNELTAKVDAVKAELSALVSFGGGITGGGNLTCPPDASFSFFGTPIALCSETLLSSTSTLGTAILFVAMVVSLYIVLS